MGRPTLYISVCAILLALVAMPTRAFAADDPALTKTLADKGLTKSGTLLLLDTDLHIADLIRDVRQREAQMADYNKKHQAVEKQIRAAELEVLRLGSENSRISTDRDFVAGNNSRGRQLVGQFNQNIDAIKRGELYIADRRKDAGKLNDPSDAYIKSVTAMCARVEKAMQDYDALAKDDAVTQAIAKLNEATENAKYRLGPSPRINSELPGILKLKQTISDSVIKLVVRANVPRVLVSLNNHAPFEMLFDTGASSVLLTEEVAKNMDVERDKDAKPVQVTIADGSKVDAYLATIKSVRVGPFTVKDVEAVIVPRAGKGDDCLLGGTFSGNFRYRIDLAAAELHLSPNSPDVTVGDDTVTASGPTTSPANGRTKTIFDVPDDTTTRTPQNSNDSDNPREHLTDRPKLKPASGTIVPIEMGRKLSTDKKWLWNEDTIMPPCVGRDYIFTKEGGMEAEVLEAGTVYVFTHAADHDKFHDSVETILLKSGYQKVGEYGSGKEDGRYHSILKKHFKKGDKISIPAISLIFF